MRSAFVPEPSTTEPAMPSLSILAAQIHVPPTPDAAARDAHVDRLSGLIDEALSEERADLVVLPELSSIDYSRASFAALEELAEPLGGPTFSAFSKVAEAHGCHILYGFAREADNGFRIAHALIGPDGKAAGHFDKLHLAQYGASMEKEYFEEGDTLFVFDVNGVRLAPIICYDIRFPDLTRTLCRNHGVQVVLHCGAYFKDESYWSWYHFVVARAVENQVYLLSLNRAGADWGGSMFCAPWADETAEPLNFGDEETLVRFEVDTGQIDQVRRDYTFVEDAKTDYAALSLKGPGG